MSSPNSPRPRAPSGGLTFAVAAAAFGLLLGFVAGGVGPRRSLAAAEAENSRLKDELVKASSQAARRQGLGGGLLGGLGGLLGEAAEAPPPREDRGAPPPTDAPTGGGPGGGVEGEAPAAEGPVAEGPVAEERDPEAELRAFEQAAELQAARAAQTRAAIIEQAELDPEEQATMDGIVSSLEERLAEHADAMAQIIASGEEPSTAEALQLTHEISGALYEAQAGMEGLLGPERLDALDPEATPIWNLIEIDGLHDPFERALEARP